MCAESSPWNAEPANSQHSQCEIIFLANRRPALRPGYGRMFPRIVRGSCRQPHSEALEAVGLREGMAQGGVTSMSKQNPNRRSCGTGRLYIKSGAYYGRWWIDGRRVNRKLGKVREPGSREGLTKREAEAAMRRQIQLVTAAPTQERLSVADAGDRLVELLELKGRKTSTIEAVRSALRVHLIPQFDDRPLDRIDVRGGGALHRRRAPGWQGTEVDPQLPGRPALHLRVRDREGMGEGEPGEAGGEAGGRRESRDPLSDPR